MVTEILTTTQRVAIRAKPYYERTMAQQYAFNNIKTIGYLDIETSGLTANFDIILSYAILIRDTQTGTEEIRGGTVCKKDFEYAFRKKNAYLIDKRLVTQLIKDMEGIDCFIGHWFIGKHRHDIPFIRTRCALTKIRGFPTYRRVRYGDTQKWGSTIYRLHNNGLDTIARMYETHINKTPLEPQTWVNACIGIKDALKYVYEHNIIDVKLTQIIHKGMEQFVPMPSTYY